MGTKDLRELFKEDSGAISAPELEIISRKSHESADFRCYECNGSGKQYNSSGDRVEHHQYNTTSVRYFECGVCRGNGVVNFNKFNKQGWFKMKHMNLGKEC